MRRAVARVAIRVMPTTVTAVIWRNPLFDAEWYVGRYPDVHRRGLDPERHYRRHGVAEGRDPNAYFDTNWYLSRYPDTLGSRLKSARPLPSLRSLRRARSQHTLRHELLHHAVSRCSRGWLRSTPALSPARDR